MRKNLLRLLLVAACALPLMCSCSKDEDSNGNRQEQEEQKKQVNYTGEWELELTILGPVDQCEIIVNIGAECETVPPIHLYDVDSGKEVGELVKGSKNQQITFIAYPETAEEAHYHLKTSSNCVGIALYSNIGEKVNENTPVEYQWTIRKDGFHVGSGTKKIYDPNKAFLEVNGRTLLETM